MACQTISLYIITLDEKKPKFRWNFRRKNINYRVVNYIKHPLSESELKNIAKKLGFRPRDFIRKSERDFKDLNLSNKLDDDDALFAAMTKFPKLLERPIVVNGNKACIGRPPEKILDII